MSYCGLIDAKLRAFDKDIPVRNLNHEGPFNSDFWGSLSSVTNVTSVHLIGFESWYEQVDMRCNFDWCLKVNKYIDWNKENSA